MRRLIASIAAGIAVALGAAGTVHAAGPPAEFGLDWDDPRTAAPPIEKPDTRSCTVQIVDDRFDDFTPYRGTYSPPPDCAGPWQKVVLRLAGAVAGRQFDRLGYLAVGGATIFKTSTPEPSVAGIRWSVEKDVTGYAALLSRPQPVEMLIANVVDDTYTGVLDVQVYLTFYPGRASYPDVLPLAGDVTVPRNTERLVAEAYATGSGGGCEEFWYLTTPTGAPYSCPADNGPYREVRIRVDGSLAGIAAPYPHVYTGGWSNPFLWYVIPAPRAFDIQPIRYDLTPFVGLLTDGRPHRVEVSVLGVPAGQSGWDVPANVLVWRDPGATRVTGKLIRHQERALRNTATYTPGTEHRVTTDGSHGLTVTGYVDTSHGRVYTTVDRTVGNHSTHLWTDGETRDALTATWNDNERTTVAGGGRSRVTTANRRYLMDGEITIDETNRLATTITLTDRGPGYVDTYRGEASWLLGVPREERHAVGTSSERYRSHGYDRLIATRNGFIV